MSTGRQKSFKASVRANNQAYAQYKQEKDSHMNYVPIVPIIVCLCGSTRFSETFHEANLRETLAGKIVLSIGCDFKSDSDLEIAGQLTEEDKKRLDELHLRKIDLADEVLILNVGGYIGVSTAREAAYAKLHGKRIRWLEDV